VSQTVLGFAKKAAMKDLNLSAYLSSNYRDIRYLHSFLILSVNNSLFVFITF